MSRLDPGRAPRGPLPPLHAVTDDLVLASPGWPEQALEVLRAGRGKVALHLRGPRTPPRTLLALADYLRPASRESGATLLVNDRIDVVLAGDLDGAHLAGHSLPVAAVRAVVGPDRWLGVSCHGGVELEAAARDGADFAFMGTIHGTPSHPGREGMGLAGLSEVAAAAGPFPLIGIGGIGPDEASGVVEAGAQGVAAIRGIWSAPDPGAAVLRYLQALGI